MSIEWRFRLGLALLVLSVAAPLLGVPLVSASGLSATVTATVSAVLLASGEVLGITAVAVMGKDGFARIKGHVLGLLKRHGPPREVSRTRYNIGLVMFCVPLVFGWASTYVLHFIPGLTAHLLPYSLGGDLLLVASLFVLGGEFWEKIRALFVHGATANASSGSLDEA